MTKEIRLFHTLSRETFSIVIKSLRGAPIEGGGGGGGAPTAGACGAISKTTKAFMLAMVATLQCS